MSSAEPRGGRRAVENWAGSDFQRGGDGDGAVALCGACRRTRQCRLGLTTERLGDDGVVRSELVCSADHEGGPGVAHGGWTAGVFDELLGHVPMLHGTLSVTKSIEISFLRPVPIEVPLRASAWREDRENGRWRVVGELRLASSGAVLGRAEGLFVERDPSHFDRFERWLAEQSERS